MARPKLFTDRELLQMGGKPFQAPSPVGRSYIKTLESAVS